jgi:Protein of unknown function (DUF1553)/Protein of unknown function (DUF1549)/Planctomycete cytochrome C
MRYTLLLWIGLTALSAQAQNRAVEDHFEGKIRPLLLEQCIRCHGPEKQKGGLRLDSKTGWQQGGDSGPAIMPGKVEQSRLLRAISYTDRDLKMPPDKKLSETDIAELQHWVATGAHDPRQTSEPRMKPSQAQLPGRNLWSMQLPKAKPAPAIKDEAWPRNEIDRHVLAQLEQRGLSPAAEADPATLRRRLAYDLTGIPSEGDASIDAMLASTAFAERWGQHWLDAARFAESSGGGRTLPFKDAWRYRDYVIESLQANIPLDRFITEQIAGDLLPFHSPAQRRRQLIATGFLVLGATNYEEQDKAALRMDIVDEQLDLIGRSLLGMSIGCARCHDHKFDPIPARDYYALAGILRSTKVIRDPKENVAHWIDSPLPMDPDQEPAMQQHEAKLAACEERIGAVKKRLKKLTPKIEPKDGKTRPLEVVEVPGIVVDDDQAKPIGSWQTSNRYPTYIGAGYQHDDKQPKGELSMTFSPEIPTSGVYEVRLAYVSTADRASNVPVHILHASGETDITVDQSTVPPIDGRFISLGQYRFEAGGQGYVMVSNEGTTGVVTVDAVTFIPEAQLAALATAEAKDKPQKTGPLAQVNQQLKELEAELKTLLKSAPKRPEAMVVAEHEDLGDCAVHVRGSIRNLGEVVPRGFLTAATHGPLHAIPTKQSGRIQLAAWLTSQQNALTARVLANRVWMHLFGEGIVRTVDNFGMTGEAPSHPALLDHLALKLISNGWSLKGLIRYIIDSRSYRMSSLASNSQAAQQDPDNRWLWRQNRKRQDAQALRDTMLVVAGTLDREYLGPTLRNAKGAKDGNDMTVQDQEYTYVYSDLRRSVYTPAFRNRRLELFDAFDFGNINVPIGKRSNSIVAPQALYLMNHDFVIQRSQEAATRLTSNAPSDTKLIDQAYLKILGRRPSKAEHTVALTFLANTQGHREASWAQLIQSLFACADFRYLD